MVLLEKCPKCKKGRVPVALDGNPTAECNSCGAKFQVHVKIDVTLKPMKEYLKEEVKVK